MFQKTNSTIRWAKPLMIAHLCLLFVASSQLFAQPSFTPFHGACPVTWGPTVQISHTPSDAVFPRLAIVGDGVEEQSTGDLV